MKNPLISCGIDEVGRGALAGPLVVACVSFDNYVKIPHGIKDSKKTSENTRKTLYENIKNIASVGYSIISSEIIDKIGIQESTLQGSIDSFKNIKKNIDIILMDGNLTPNFKKKSYSIIKGDSNYVSIAAASIVAKHIRDNLMIDLHNEFNNYHWKRNKGYGTKEHLLAIKKNGICKQHRKSYEPIRSIIKYEK